MWASTTYAADLAARVSEILARRHYGVYHVVNAGVCSYYDFAVEAARAAGLSGAEAARLIEKISKADAGLHAPRPSYTPMRCLLSERLGLAPMRDWREALDDYVHN
jgi:dTDP-4-dehydrorhamnose reductase